MRSVPFSGQPHAGFRADIEGLRGIAVGLVVAYHVGIPGFGGGYIGVDVFFVLSGYLITGLLVTEWERSGSLALRTFYGRRMRRLLPAAAVVWCVAMLGAVLVDPPLQLKAITASALATSLYASNWYFLHQASDYFAASVQTNPFLHTWWVCPRRS